ncbi:MAG: tetratricopeptide repeat protein [Chloroflexia bacterium]|nr:tetratricopeptide repeat protein [Chloroflexia bacterium]
MMPKMNARQLEHAPLRAGFLLIAGQINEARALCEQALAEAPVDWPGRGDALRMLTRVARRQHDWSRALEALNEVLKLTPDAAAAWYQRGLVKRSLAQWEAAVADMEQAVALATDPAELAHFVQGLAVTQTEARAAQQDRHKPPRTR